MHHTFSHHHSYKPILGLEKISPSKFIQIHTWTSTTDVWSVHIVMTSAEAFENKSSALKCGENFILLLKSVLGAQCKTAQFLRDTHPLTFASGQKTLLCLFWNSNRDPGKANRFFLKFSKRVSKSQRKYKCNSQTDESKMICFQVYWRIYESQTDHTFSLCMENNGIW